MADHPLFQVAVDAPILQHLTYSSSEVFLRGQPVTVPLGKRQTRGFVVGPGVKVETKFQIKAISGPDLQVPQIPENYFKWFEWVADYYVYPLGLVLNHAYPPLENKTAKRKSKKSAVVPVLERNTAPKLSEEQNNVINNIPLNSEFKVHLVHGVTGSGKTEVYMNLLEKVLANDQRGLVLVPEISLTPQLVDRFARRFGDAIAVLHSHLTDRERTDQWWSIFNGEKKILIGARSALFCPMKDLGLIIVDEEHEPSFKQDEKLKYHGRDCAIMLAKNLKIPILLGSATPSLESWQHAQAGKYVYHHMPSRVAARSLPKVDIIDMRTKKSEGKTLGMPFWLSSELYQEMIVTLEKKQQVALFLNRRGVAQSVFCRDCGFSYKCPNCDISLTLHGKRNLVCHYCDYTILKMESCPSCKTGEPTDLGVGTELIENDLRTLFPEARIARADRDEIQNRESLEELIHKMEKNEIDILVGTQMIAKGLDFPHLTLVGLVMADVGFNMPDFRASERSFQLITQVSGRAGRHAQAGGRVYIQTYNPEHISLEFAKTANFKSFADKELIERRECHYPPFGRLASIRITSTDVKKAEELAAYVVERAEQLTKRNASYNNIQVLGPAPAPLFKIRGKYRFHVLLKSSVTSNISPFCRQILSDEKWIPSGTKVHIDVDPLSML
jgi:primosomal protein N' (replication factor Y)